MTESAGVYGPYFEWSRVKLKNKEVIQPNPNLLAYQAKCSELFLGLSIMNHTMEDGIAIRVNTPTMRDGLILRETFTDWDIAYKDKLVINAFLMTPNAIYKINNLTPKALEKAEKAEVGFRLRRLEMVSDKIWIRDIFLDNKRQDAELLDRTIKRSVEAAKKKVGPQEYFANLATLN